MVNFFRLQVTSICLLVKSLCWLQHCYKKRSEGPVYLFGTIRLLNDSIERVLFGLVKVGFCDLSRWGFFRPFYTLNTAPHSGAFSYFTLNALPFLTLYIDIKASVALWSIIWSNSRKLWTPNFKQGARWLVRFCVLPILELVGYLPGSNIALEIIRAC
jgi:hypothetical protein